MASPERELKLSVAPSFEMPVLDGLGDGVVPVRRDPELLSTVYFDTDDLRLARWGVSVRHRLGQGWTVKLPPEQRDALLVRPEIVFGGAARRPPGPVSDLVRAFTRGAPLLPRTRLRTTRRRVELRDQSGRLVAHVFEDAVSVRGSEPTAAAAFHEVEVEIDDATPDELLEALVTRLRDAGADGGDPTPKYLRSLGSVDLAPVVEVPELAVDATAGDLVRRAVASAVARLVVHDPVIRLDDDPEGVHQARVATRRLRSDLRTFRTLVDSARAGALRGELRWLGGVLGDVRDGDVLLERLRALATTLPDEHRRGVTELLASLERERDAHHVALLDALRGPRYVRLLDVLVVEARSLPLLEDAGFPARDIGPSLARRPWRALAKHVNGLGKKAGDRKLHEARILAKRTRYAAEAVAPAIGEPAKTFARAAADLQDVLGELNDAVVAAARLDAWAATASDTGAAAATALADLERERARRKRKEWRRAWKALSARELRAWM